MNKVQIAARFYDCRDGVRKFFGKEYKSKIDIYMGIIKTVMKANNLDEVSAYLKIMEDISVKENPISKLLFTAAIVELVEPSTVS